MAKEKEFSPQEILDHVRPTPQIINGLTNEDKVKKIEKKFFEIMEILGLDLENDSLQKSPKRVAKMYVEELFSGLNTENFPKITVYPNEMNYDQMVVIRDVKINSICEHHFVTIEGKATIAYIPSKNVIGLSKINRVAEFFSRRPQIQERLTKQIADCLSFILETEDVAVYITAKHHCVVSRGIRDINSLTTTSDLRGAFRSNQETRAEFLRGC